MPDPAPATVFGPHPGSRHAHEQVVFGADDASGLRVIVGIYSTALGPALGGTRFYPYAGEADALADVLELSRAMAYKNALAGLDHGGGKAVIIGDPAVDKTEALLLAYGRLLDGLGGRYVTACDVGTYVQDMDVVARATRFATGRSPENGGAGDSSVLTAYGVFEGMRAGAEHLWGAPTLAGRTVGIAGVGKVGRHLVGHLVEDGATVVVTDVSAAAVDVVRQAHPERRGRRRHGGAGRGRPGRLLALRAGPRAHRRGGRGAVGPAGLRRGQQPAGPPRHRGPAGRAGHPLRAGLLRERGRGDPGGRRAAGLLFDRAKAKAGEIFATTARVLATAAEEGIPPATAADRLAERRMDAAAGGVRPSHGPAR